MAIDDKDLLNHLNRVSRLVGRAQGGKHGHGGSGHHSGHGHGGRGGRGRGSHGAGGFAGGYPGRSPFEGGSGVLEALVGRHPGQAPFGGGPGAPGSFGGRGGHGPRGGARGGRDGWGEAPDLDHGRDGARAGQERILSMLAVKDGLSQKYLAYLLGIRPQTLSEALAKLEEQGYVERRKDENDRRVMLVYLTDDGRERAKEIDARREQRAEDIFSVLTDEEKEQLARILAKLDAGIEQQGECSEGDGGADDVFPDDDEEEAAIGDIED